jgi:hypothetical protein
VFSLLGQRCSNRLPPHHLADLEALALAVDLEALAVLALAVDLAVLALAVVPVLILVLNLVSFCPR